MKKYFYTLLLFSFLIIGSSTSTVNAGQEECTSLSGSRGINSAVGCIPTENVADFTQYVLSWAIGVAGGIAFLLIVFAGFQILTSTGNPERLKAGQELLTSAIMGLILIIFSVFILRFIGVDILNIPGFST